MKTLTGFLYYPDSLEESGGITYFLVRSEEEAVKYLGIMGDSSGFKGGSGIAGDSAASTHLFPLSHENAEVLRQRLPWLRPKPLGLRPTVSFDDRLGLATPGHIRAVEGTGIAPIFAQQSAHEHDRTGRSPQETLDDAMWGVFQSGWDDPWGAGAGSLKTTGDLDAFIHAGYTFFTIDSGEFVDPTAQEDTLAKLRQKAGALRWDLLHSSIQETAARYVGQIITIEDFTLSYTEEILYRALAKFGNAIGHTLRMDSHLQERAPGAAYELEISLDETGLPTAAEEHFLIASELQRLGVRWTSLAPRFAGPVENGAGLAGSLAEVEETFHRHAAIARRFGNYRLRLDTGPDQLSIYPMAARQTHGLVHLKTAGASYLEALRVIAQVNPELFRNILELAIERYYEEHAPDNALPLAERAGSLKSIHDPALAALLDQRDTRQILDATYEPALDRFGPVLLETLRSNENLYYEALDDHFRKHLAPFLQHSAD